MEIMKKIIMMVILSFLIIILFHYSFNLLVDIFAEDKTKNILKISKDQYESFKKTLNENQDNHNDSEIDMEKELKNYIEDIKTT